MHHIDAFLDVKKCQERVEAFISQDEIKVVDFTHDFFGDLIDHDVDERVWKDDVDQSNFSVMMKAVLQAVHEVINRQYNNYYNTEDTDDRRCILESARTHNIDSEEVMGMFSANIARAPRATLLFVSSKI